MNYKELSAELSKGALGSVYLFISKDDYIANSYVALIKKLAVGEDFAELNVNYFNDKKPDAKTFSESLVTLPVMAQKRLVVLRQAEISASGELGKALAAYLEAPCESTVLIVYVNEMKNPLSDKFKAVAKTVTFEKLRGYDLENWVENTFKKRGLSIKKDALKELINNVDYGARTSESDTGALINEINKLAAASGGKKEINLALVKATVSINKNEDMYKYGDALVQKQLAAALEQLDKLFYNKISPQYILSCAESALRDRALFLYCKNNGISESEIARKYKAAPFRVTKCLKLRGHDVRKSLKALTYIYEADISIKKFSVEPQNALYRMTEAVCSL